MSTYRVISLPKTAYEIFGKPNTLSPSTYEKSGDFDLAQSWFGALREIVGEVISLPSVSLFIPVSRNAIHKRVKDGSLSCFKFTIRGSGSTGSKSLNRERPHAFVPVIECKIWYQEFLDRKAQGPDGDGFLLDWLYLDEVAKTGTKFDEVIEPIAGHWKDEFSRMKTEYYKIRERKMRDE